MPAVATEKVVAEAVEDDVALVEPRAMERVLVTPHGADRLPGATRGRREGGGAVGGAISTPPVTTMGSRVADLQ